MENLIPLFFVIITAIISLFATARKQQSGQQKDRSTQETEGQRDEWQSHEHQNGEKFSERQPSSRTAQNNNQGTGSFQQQAPQGYRQAPSPQKPEQEIGATPKRMEEPFAEPSLEEKKQQISEKTVSFTKDQQEQDEAPSREKKSKPKRTTKTRKRTRQKSKLQTIREDFDVEEAIIYSEIIQRKYF